MNQSSNLLLTSSGIDTPWVRSALSERIVGLYAKSAVIVTTASREHKEKSKHAIATRETFLALGLETVDYLDVEFEDATNLLTYDVVYVVGGHPFYLLHHLNLSGAGTILREIHAQNRAVIVGSSAGAVVLGPDLRIVATFDPDLSTSYGSLAGIGLVPFTVLPHVNRWQERLPDLVARLHTFTRKTELRVETIRDGEALQIGADGQFITLGPESVPSPAW